MSFLESDPSKYSPLILYTGMINEYLNVKELTPKNKDEIQPIIFALNIILNPGHLITTGNLDSDPIQQRIERVMELKDDMEFLGIREGDREAFGELVDSLVRRKIQELNDPKFLHQNEITHEELEKKKEEAANTEETSKRVREIKEKKFAEENRGTSLEKNMLKLIHAGELADIEIGQMVFLYQAEDITILRDETIVDAIVDKKISLEKALSGGSLVISKFLSIDDFVELPEDHCLALANNPTLQRLIKEKKIPLEQFKQPLNFFRSLQLRDTCILELIDHKILTFEKFKELNFFLSLDLCKNRLLCMALLTKKISIEKLEEIHKDVRLDPGSLILLLANRMTLDQLIEKKRYDFAIDVIDIERVQKKKIEAFGEQVTFENKAWLISREVILHDIWDQLSVINLIFKSFVVALAMSYSLESITRRFVTPLLCFTSIYSLVYEVIDVNPIEFRRSFLSHLLKRIAYVAMTIFCLWMDTNPMKFRILLTKTLPLAVAAAGMASVLFARLRTADADALANRYSSEAELAKGQWFLETQQKRNREARQKSLWNWIRYTGKGDERFNLFEASLSSRIAAIIKKHAQSR